MYARGVYVAVRYNCVFVFFKKKQTDSWGDGVIIQTRTGARAQRARETHTMPNILLYAYRHPSGSAPRGATALAIKHHLSHSTFTGMMTRGQHYNWCVQRNLVQSGDVFRVPEGPRFNQFEVHNHAGDALSANGVMSLAAQVLSLDLGYVRRFPSAATFREERLATQATVTLQQEQTLEQLLNWHCIDIDGIFGDIEAIAVQRRERRPMPQGIRGWATDANRREIPLMVRGVVLNGNSRSSPILPLDQVLFPAGTVLPLLQLALQPAQICNQCPDRVVTDPSVIASMVVLPNQTVPGTTMLGSDQDPSAVYERRADAVYQIGLRETMVQTIALGQTRTVMPVVLYRNLSEFFDWESRPTTETIADHTPFTGAFHPLPSLQRGRGRGRGAGRAATNSRHHPYQLPPPQGGAGDAQSQGRQAATDQNTRDTAATVDRQREHAQLMADGGGGSSVVHPAGTPQQHQARPVLTDTELTSQHAIAASIGQQHSPSAPTSSIQHSPADAGRSGSGTDSPVWRILDSPRGQAGPSVDDLVDDSLGTAAAKESNSDDTNEFNTNELFDWLTEQRRSSSNT